MRKLLLVLVVIVSVAGFFVYRTFNKPHRTADGEVSFSVTAPDLFRQFEENELDANQKFLDKALEVTGQVSSVSKNQQDEMVLVLKTDNDFFGVSCTMLTEERVNKGDSVVVLGFCTGYLSDVVINRAKIINQKQ